ncbi:hypothetical protein E2C01_073475 [Portunus trituberculatus]|uniref:Uncharacterized protein n=1 Tax=Portunus trituberculatus TaxID=210409 RepID=A0A5B7IE14_PORTR|nr:hypothetical protein [Portunus trituberculatus]
MGTDILTHAPHLRGIEGAKDHTSGRHYREGSWRGQGRRGAMPSATCQGLTV